MLKLYYSPGSCALASHLALEEAGAKYEASKIDFSQNQQRSPDYLKINPKGRVPALITDKGILTETPAILVYIAQTHPAAKLAPLDDPFTLAKIQAFNSYLCSTVHVAHAHRVRGTRWADNEASIADMKAKAPSVVQDCFALIEREMFAGPWAMGDSYTICDPYLFTLETWWEGDSVDPKRLPKLADHRKRMEDRPAVARALAAEGKH
ncbi:MAG: glutathione S-transferase family protein [Alphaproteobacteria bacterium]|nr:glutathione S-transferase family protein [Alphaproteobacteria bacterium]